MISSLIIHPLSVLVNLEQVTVDFPLHLMCMCLDCGVKMENQGRNPCRHKENMQTPKASNVGMLHFNQGNSFICFFCLKHQCDASLNNSSAFRAHIRLHVGLDRMEDSLIKVITLISLWMHPAVKSCNHHTLIHQTLIDISPSHRLCHFSKSEGRVTGMNKEVRRRNCAL